jgi:flagellar protein FliS
VDGPTAYKENAVLTQSRGRIVVMLYDGAIKFLHQAIAGIEQNDHEAKAKFLGKAMDIIWELDNCLDVEAGGEVAGNLRALYGFMRRHLLDASIKQDPQRIRDVIACLEDLNEGWKAVTT